MTGLSGAATEKFRFTANGELGVGGANYGTDGQVLTSTGAGTAPAWECVSGGGCVVCDSTPQLGGSLDAQTNTILNIGHADNDILAGGIRVVNGSEAAPSLSFTNDPNTGAFTAGNDCFRIATNGVADFRVVNSVVHVNESGNGKMCAGLTIQQCAADTEILALKSSDVAHGMTGEAETDTYGVFKKIAPAWGGLLVLGYGENEEGLYLSGRAVNTDTTKNTSADAPLALDARLKTGTGTDEVASNGNLVTISTTDTTRFIFDKEGSGHADIEFTTYDDYNDIELMRGVHGALVPCYTKNFGQDMVYNICQYQEMGLIGRCSVHWEEHDDGTPQLRGMVNMTKLAMLHHSTIIQLADNLNARIDGIETQLRTLTEGK